MAQPGFATLLTREGIRPVDRVDPGQQIWNGTDWVLLTNKETLSYQEVYSFRSSAGVFIGTDDHRVLSNSIRRRVKTTSSMDICLGEVPNHVQHVPMDVLDGMVFGDGMVHKASNNKVLLCIGKKDHSLFDSEVSKLIGDAYSTTYSFKVKSSITAEEIPKTYEREIPRRFILGGPGKRAAFLRGLYSANGSVSAKRIGLKAASFPVIIQTQEILSSLGISSYWTTNIAHDTTFKNGTYRVRESYDLNVGSLAGRLAFRKLIGFVQPAKQFKLERACDQIKFGGKPKTSYPVNEIESLGNFPVYAMTVVGSEYWSGGALVSDNS